MFCRYCRWFLKDKSAVGSLTGNNGFRIDGIKKQMTSEAHFLVKNLSVFYFLGLNWAKRLPSTTKIFHGQPKQVLWLPQGQQDINENFEPCNGGSRGDN